MINSNEIEEKHITTYQEIIDRISGLRIENGNLVNIGAKASLNLPDAGIVELWVDGVKWDPNGKNKDNEIVGVFNEKQIGGNPKANRHFETKQTNIFTEFTTNFPIHSVESIHYYRSSVATLISSTAALNAGALVITTKDGSKAPNIDQEVFVKAIRPLGYQKATEFYKPHFEYDPVGTEYVISSVWYPAYNGIDTLPSIENADVIIEGISNDGLPIHISTVESRQ